MADEREAVVPKVLDEGAEIFNRRPDPVAVNAVRLGGEVVASLIRGND